MRKFLIFTIASCLTGCIFILQACFKDTITKTYSYTFYEPVYKTVEEVRTNIKSNTAQPVNRPGKLFVKGQYIFLNEIDKGIHVIDNSNPSQPRNLTFIDIPGNMDLAVKGNTLYADLYTDLVAIDITNPGNVVLKKVVEGVFPYRAYTGNFLPAQGKIITSWIKKDTTVSEKFSVGNWAKSSQVFMSYAADAGGSKASVSPYGVGGSMARFTIINERMYTVGNSELQVFNITNSTEPVFIAKKNMTGMIETIYPFRNKLFIGSQSGMFIYNLVNPDNPQLAGQFSHVQSCDPVIADNDYAYVTLRSGSACQGFTNELDILKLNNLTDPSLVKVYPMSNPHGLSKDGNTLFLCDGKDGLKIFNASNVANLQLIKKIGNLETFDVIAYGGIALVVAKDGLYQFDYSDLNNIQQVSKINIENR